MCVYSYGLGLVCVRVSVSEGVCVFEHARPVGRGGRTHTHTTHGGKVGTTTTRKKLGMRVMSALSHRCRKAHARERGA